MIVHVLACDYDGTIADHGHVPEHMRRALARVRESGRRVVLVTGRMLPDLRHVCPDTDAMFDAVVAENGGVLYLPATREVRILGDPPEPKLVDGLRRRGVPIDLGSAIIATLEPFATETLGAIQEAGVERTLVFNKGALMLLPGGVTKGTGLQAGLDVLGYSMHNVVGCGDGENDHAFLSMCEFSVAVADAVPALRERADFVTAEPASRGVTRFIEDHVLTDLAALAPRVTRHAIVLGTRADGVPVGVPAHTTQLLVVGPSASGKSTLTGVLVERLVETGRTVCLVDPEGDYRTLADLERVLVMGGTTNQALPTSTELEQLLRRPRAGLVLNLSAMSRAEKIDYGTRVLGTVAAVRGSSGMPHWLIIDEAHHLFPADGSPAAELVRPGGHPVCLITLTADDLARELRTVPNVVASTELSAFCTALERVTRAGCHGLPPELAADGAPLERGEAALAWLNGERSTAARFRVARRRIQHRRHVRKYTEGELPVDRSFFFRGREGSLKLRASNVTRFCELADGVDEATWEFHLRAGDYSRWLRDVIKDPNLADEVRGIEQDRTLSPADSRQRALAAIRREYAV
jgi:hydroxymethylpyrimidine pyrophosphatase-like HAD family hydrolase